MATDPFGKSVFGGQTSLVPGGTSMATSAAAKPVDPYKWKGQGWNDPLAQQIYSKYGNTQGDRLAEMANDQMAAGMQGINYQTPIDPSKWGGAFRGDMYDKMKADYIDAGGLGTADQLAGTYKTPAETAAATALAKTGGTGSSFSLDPSILGKMWR